jgi:hypothetical protein
MFDRILPFFAPLRLISPLCPKPMRATRSVLLLVWVAKADGAYLSRDRRNRPLADLYNLNVVEAARMRRM